VVTTAAGVASEAMQAVEAVGTAAVDAVAAAAQYTAAPVAAVISDAVNALFDIPSTGGLNLGNIAHSVADTLANVSAPDPAAGAGHLPNDVGQANLGNLDPGQFQPVHGTPVGTDLGTGSAGAPASPAAAPDGGPAGTPATGGDSPMYHPDLPTPEK
jgi:hypothetical protein